jgi:hypothetical protein
MTADGPLEQPYVTERVETSILAVSPAGGEHQGEITRLTGFQKPVF